MPADVSQKITHNAVKSTARNAVARSALRGAPWRGPAAPRCVVASIIIIIIPAVGHNNNGPTVAPKNKKTTFGKMVKSKSVF